MATNEETRAEVTREETKEADEIKDKDAIAFPEEQPEMDIIISGGYGQDFRPLTSVEMFRWKERSWTSLPPLQLARSSHSSFIYQNQVFIAGGYSGLSTDSIEMIKTNEDNQPVFPDKLPFRCFGHASFVYGDRLIIIGGYHGKDLEVTNGIYEFLLTEPYSMKLLTEMATTRIWHRAVPFGDQIFIFGGRIHNNFPQCTDIVEMFDVKTNQCKQVAGLPLGLSGMGAVRWKDNVVLLGGADRRGNLRDDVLMYNITNGKTTRLPEMKNTRQGCSAVVCGGSIIVMGGYDGECMSSVEAFSFDRNTWEEMPAMSKARSEATVVFST